MVKLVLMRVKDTSISSSRTKTAREKGTDTKASTCNWNKETDKLKWSKKLAHLYYNQTAPK